MVAANTKHGKRSSGHVARVKAINAELRQIIYELKRDGLLQFAEFSECIAEVVVRFSQIGLNGESLGDQIDGFVVPAHLVGDHTQHNVGLQAD